MSELEKKECTCGEHECDCCQDEFDEPIELIAEDGKKLKTMAANIGDFVSITGNTFCVRNGSWLYTYDISGKKINTRPAR